MARSHCLISSRARDLAILNRQLAQRELLLCRRLRGLLCRRGWLIGWYGLLRRLGSGLSIARFRGMTKRSEVPHPGGVLDQVDAGTLQTQGVDLELLMQQR